MRRHRGPWFGAHLALGVTLALSSFSVWAAPATEAIDPAALPGVVVDDRAAELTGVWKASTHTSPFVGEGYQHDENEEKGNRRAKFTPDLPKAGNYQVLLSYTPGSTRAANIPVTVTSADGVTTVYVDQRQKPAVKAPFLTVGVFHFEKGKSGSVLISNEGTRGYVILDAVQFVPTEDAVTPADMLVTKPIEVKPLPEKNPKPASLVKAKRAAASEAPPVAEASAPTEPFTFPKPAGRPRDSLKKITSVDLDELIEAELKGVALAPPVGDEQFLRRATLDLIGRQPTPAEFDAFMADNASDKRTRAIDRLLALEEFGANWANYWSDTISHRVQPPELTFLSYSPLKDWLAKELNRGASWDEIAKQLITAKGKVQDNPANTFIGFHQGNPISLAGETSRIFLAVQINCAECHDHPFDHWKQDEFHRFAAFFARSKVKMPQKESAGCEVIGDGKNELKLPKSGKPAVPTFLTGEVLPQGSLDSDRRLALAEYIASDNPWFAKAYVNRVWSRLLARGFYEPVDNMGDNQPQQLPKIHTVVADHFTASGYDIKDFFRLVMNSQSYQRQLPDASWGADEESSKRFMAAGKTGKLRGDEVFDSLAMAIGLPNFTPPPQKAPPGQRFPPPPKSTRDLVNDTFGYDPSLAPDDVSRTMAQAMMLMNNEQIQKQVDGTNSETLLTKLLSEEPDDAKLVDRLFRQALARRPSDGERAILLEHIKAAKSRSEGFEDLYWSLINSTEFTTKR